MYCLEQMVLNGREEINEDSFFTSDFSPFKSLFMWVPTYKWNKAGWRRHSNPVLYTGLSNTFSPQFELFTIWGWWNSRYLGRRTNSTHLSIVYEYSPGFDSKMAPIFILPQHNNCGARRSRTQPISTKSKFCWRSYERGMEGSKCFFTIGSFNSRGGGGVKLRCSNLRSKRSQIQPMRHLVSIWGVKCRLLITFLSTQPVLYIRDSLLGGTWFQ